MSRVVGRLFCLPLNFTTNGLIRHSIFMATPFFMCQQRHRINNKMIKTSVFILLSLLTLSAGADDTIATKNFCTDPVNTREFDDLLSKHSTDAGIIRLVALRIGLCAMIDTAQITLAAAIDLWAVERQKMLIELLNPLPKKPVKTR
jgi:hypothetical protein